MVWAGEACWADIRIDEVDEAVFRPKEAWAAADVRVTDQHVCRHSGVRCAALVRDNRPDRRIRHRAAGSPARVDEVGCERVLVDDLVRHRADGGESIHQYCRFLQVFAHPHPAHGGFDRVVERAGRFGRSLRVAPGLRIEGVDLTHAAAEPDEDTMVGFTSGVRFHDWCLGGQRRRSSKRGGRLEKAAAVHVVHDSTSSEFRRDTDPTTSPVHGTNTNSEEFTNAHSTSSNRVRQPASRRFVGGSPFRAAASCCWRTIVASGAR